MIWFSKLNIISINNKKGQQIGAGRKIGTSYSKI